MSEFRHDQASSILKQNKTKILPLTPHSCPVLSWLPSTDNLIRRVLYAVLITCSPFSCSPTHTISCHHSIKTALAEALYKCHISKSSRHLLVLIVALRISYYQSPSPSWHIFFSWFLEIVSYVNDRHFECIISKTHLQLLPLHSLISISGNSTHLSGSCQEIWGSFWIYPSFSLSIANQSSHPASFIS